MPLGFTDVCWVVYLNDLPVGFACLRHLKYEPNSVFFSRAGLLPIARGNGLHKRLIGVRLSYCKRESISSVITYTLDTNFASANNLTAYGFKLYEPAERWADSSSKKEVLYFYRNI